MRTIVKRGLMAFGGLIALAVTAVTVKFYVLSPASRAVQEVKAPSTPEAIARGQYLANNVTMCLACHSNLAEDKPGRPMVEGSAGSGRDFKDDTFPGQLRAPNLSADKQVGLGAWSDGEILRAMREGIGRDGRALFPMMPYTVLGANLNDADALAIIAYLRTLPAIASTPGKLEVNFPVSMFIRGEPKPVPTPAGPVPTDPLARGKWLLAVSNCSLCHDTFDSHRQPLPGMTLAGGLPWKIAEGTVYSANITSDKATGIGAYSDEDILRVLNEGKTKSGRQVYEMPWAFYKGMTEDDKKSLILALRSIPAVSHAVPVASLK